jgi:beta-phosphoglucomutase-like phosphatase (HAD superfamily)
MKILTDADGVLLDWTHSFDEWMLENGVHKKQDVYKVSERFGLTHDEGRIATKTFNQSAAIGFLAPFRDSVKYVKKLHEEMGITFDCITSLGTNRHAIKLRKENLRRLFGKTAFDVIQCLSCGADKAPALAKYAGCDYIWVEDKWENAIAGANMGFTTFIIDHAYNAHEQDDRIVRVSSWREIYEALKI